MHHFLKQYGHHKADDITYLLLGPYARFLESAKQVVANTSVKRFILGIVIISLIFIFIFFLITISSLLYTFIPNSSLHISIDVTFLLTIH